MNLPASAGSAKLAVRVPGHPRLLRLLQEIGPLTATSANRSGEDPVLDPGGAVSLVGGENAVLVDDGRLPGGPPSTMVALEGDRARILREGRVSSDRLARLAPEWFSAGTVEISVEESS
jgi:tRNA A37 threonylcarbamoyladenosine synthetase subunit TsaC/SUA5/YrdC